MITDGLRLAVGTFTAIPIQPPVRINRSVARTAMLLAPVACLPIGLGAAGVGLIGSWVGLPLLVTAGLIVGVVALGSRGLHLDGLADTADGLAASYDRDRALEIMRRGNTGPIGAVTLVLVLLVQTAAAAAVLGRSWGPIAIGLLVCLSRCSLLISCADGVRAARLDGLGAAVAGVVPRWAAMTGLLVAAACCSSALLLTGSVWWLGAVGVLIAALVVIGLVWRTTRRFGGVSGDVLGAGIEVSLAALLVVASAGA
ncbi:MAG: adenosylcobinamide-GDP ribazoletransferase [Nakamurella sp.]